MISGEKPFGHIPDLLSGWRLRRSDLRYFSAGSTELYKVIPEITGSHYGDNTGSIR